MYNNFFSVFSGAVLNPFISYYEPGYYNTTEVAVSLAQQQQQQQQQQQHTTRSKRSPGPLTHPPIHFHFKAHER
jgi:hypothetical protein